MFAADHEPCADRVGELSTVKDAPDSAGRLVIEPEDAMKARNVRSLDLADALAVTFAPPQAKAMDSSPPEMQDIWVRAGVGAASYREVQMPWEDDP